MELKIQWENFHIPFKNLITSFSFFGEKLFAAIFSGSIFGFNLSIKTYDIHLHFKDISIPITYLIVISESLNEITILTGLKNGKIYYNIAQFNDKRVLISEKSILLSEKIKDEIIHMSYNENSGTLICASIANIHFHLIKINVIAFIYSLLLKKLRKTIILFQLTMKV